jgi:hypothetical protein
MHYWTLQLKHAKVQTTLEQSARKLLFHANTDGRD